MIFGRRKLRALEQKVKALQPMSAPGILTNHYSNGVTRRPIQKVRQKRTRNNGSAARWS